MPAASLLLKLAVATLIFPAVGLAQSIRTDASWGRTAQTLSGPNYAIPESMGRVAGRNLFHSFQTFGLASGEAARFSTTTPTLANVLTRVTGGSPSTILGNLRLDAAPGSAPDFYLINPAGVAFGKGASVDVPAAFHVSTANSVRFADGVNWPGGQTDSVLSAAAPEAFGFVAGANAAITVRDGATLLVPGGISLTAGAIAVSGAKVQAEHGELRIVATGAGGLETPLAGAPAQGKGAFAVDSGASVGTLGGSRNAGAVFVSAGSVRIAGSGSELGSISAERSASSPGTVSIAVDGGFSIADNAIIASSTQGSGDAGLLRLTAESVDVEAAFITSASGRGSSGRSGRVEVIARGDVALQAGAAIDSSTLGSGHAGGVVIEARNVHLNGGVVSSTAFDGSSGNAGSVRIAATDAIEIRGGAASSSTFGVGNAGGVEVEANHIRIIGVGGITSQAEAGSSGHAGTISVRAGDTLTIAGGVISSSTFARGDAGRISIRGRNADISGENAGIASAVAASSQGQGGAVDIAISGDLTLADGSKIATSSFSTGNSGPLSIRARNVTLRGTRTFVDSSAQNGSTGNAGDVVVIADAALTLADGGQIGSNTRGAGNAGTIRVEAADVSMRGSETGISSQAIAGSLGNAGSVTVSANNSLGIRDQSGILSSTSARGDAGSVTVDAREIVIAGSLTGVSSGTVGAGSGKAGPVRVTAGDSLRVEDGGFIDSSSFLGGAAGTVNVAARNANLDRGGLITSVSYGAGAGPAGQIGIDVGETLSIAGGSSVSSSTYSASPAGSIAIRARELIVEGGNVRNQAEAGSTGPAGSVQIVATGSVRLRNGGAVTSSTLGFGNAGLVGIDAPEVAIDNANVSSASASTAFGNAGTVFVNASDRLVLSNGGVISTSTESALGRAGLVFVQGGDVLIRGAGSQIASEAGSTSSGRTGLLAVDATRAVRLADGGAISVRNRSPAQPFGATGNVMLIRAPVVSLEGGSIITSESSFFFPADNILMAVSDLLSLNNSFITTRANNGNGGGIATSGTQVVYLKNSAITTSVLGSAGDGGVIAMRSGALILDTGFIQANTAAANARGGTIVLEIGELLPAGNSLRVGGNTPYAFRPGGFGDNVIQAAAPTGISGNITISAPPTDISGSLAELDAPALDLGAFGRDPCSRSAGSSLTTPGRGALPSGPGGFLQPGGRAPVAPARSSNAPGKTLLAGIGSCG